MLHAADERKNASVSSDIEETDAFVLSRRKVLMTIHPCYCLNY